MVLETTNYDCPYVRKHYSAKNMQAQQREAAAKGVVWLTTASNAAGEQGSVNAGPGQRAHQEPRCRAGRRADRPAKQDRARLWRHRDAAHVHHRCQGHAGLQGRHRLDPVVDTADIPKAKQYVRVALDEVLAGKPVAEASTRPYGCTMKYPRTST